MRSYPAIALIEFSSIATGIFAGDAMVKKAPISVLKSGTVHDGKYLILIGGSVAPVEESFAEGIFVGSGQVVDQVILPNIHGQVHRAILGERKPFRYESLGVIETETVAATIQSADASIKGANVDLIEIRLADDLGGKAFAVFNGEIEDVEIAIEIAKNAVTNSDFWLRDIVIPRIHSGMVEQIDQSTRFYSTTLKSLEGREI